LPTCTGVPEGGQPGRALRRLPPPERHRLPGDQAGVLRRDHPADRGLRNVLWAGTLGIALVAGAAAAFNCLIEQKIDAVMARTRARPLRAAKLTQYADTGFSGVVGGMGLYLLHAFVNPLTMWLTLATFVGYAVIYTALLKPATPQNIVIGGASGAMPPVLGWAAATGEIPTTPAAVPDHLRLDAAAFLGAGAVPARRNMPRRDCRCCGDAR